jgi:hypothetical protein
MVFLVSAIYTYIYSIAASRPTKSLSRVATHRSESPKSSIRSHRARFIARHRDESLYIRRPYRSEIPLVQRQGENGVSLNRPLFRASRATAVAAIFRDLRRPQGSPSRAPRCPRTRCETGQTPDHPRNPRTQDRATDRRPSYAIRANASAQPSRGYFLFFIAIRTAIESKSEKPRDFIPGLSF